MSERSNFIGKFVAQKIGSVIFSFVSEGIYSLLRLPSALAGIRVRFGGDNMSKVSVRYIVNDVDAAIPFYTPICLASKSKCIRLRVLRVYRSATYNYFLIGPVLVVLDNRWQINRFLLQVAGTGSR